VQTPPGLYLAVAAGVVLIVLVFLPDLLRKAEKAEGEDASGKEE
jgi:hypothetical protein